MIRRFTESSCSFVSEPIAAASELFAMLGKFSLIAEIIKACITRSRALAENGVAVVPSTNLYS